jgi:hypothetical protein
MRSSTVSRSLAWLSLACFLAPARAQHLERPTLYRLRDGSIFQRGCFPPCACPIMEQAPLDGTLQLERVAIGDVFDFYEVRGVRLHYQPAGQPGQRVVIRGSGTYKVSTIADLHQMTLVLTVGDEPPQTFTSDEVPGGGEFPAIHLPIFVNGGYCFDTLLELVARPALRCHVNVDGLEWDPPRKNSEEPFDVVVGDLVALRGTGGDFAASTRACLANDALGNWIPFTSDPDAGSGYWFLDRPAGGSYDDQDDAQVGSADAGIAASPSACP